MKPFNLEEFKSGKKAVTRVGQTATFGGFNKDADKYYQILGWINGESYGWQSDGSYDGSPSDFDLIGMAPKKKTVWVNVYKSPISINNAVVSNGYYSKNEAMNWARKNATDYICTTSFEIEV